MKLLDILFGTSDLQPRYAILPPATPCIQCQRWTFSGQYCIACIARNKAAKKEEKQWN